MNLDESVDQIKNSMYFKGAHWEIICDFEILLLIVKLILLKQTNRHYYNFEYRWNLKESQQELLYLKKSYQLPNWPLFWMF